MIIVLMGVTGSGKTTLGRKLAEKLGGFFYDADDLHPKANKEKMGRGIALTDEDRTPWLEAIRTQLEKLKNERGGVVLACSALKQKYRDFLSAGLEIQWVYLKGDKETIRGRVEGRKGHFAGSQLVESQFKDLEEPLHAMVMDVRKSPEAIVGEILAALKGKR
jgi:carbohydrate kinase (thermoresistant glucokinase family)